MSLRLRLFLVAIFSIALAGCLDTGESSEESSDDGGGDGQPPAPASFNIVTATPGQGDRDVVIGSNLSIVFSGDLVQSQASVQLTVSDSSGSISGNMNVSGDTITFDPDQDMQYLTSYTVDVANNGGGAQVQESNWSFVTEQAPASTVVGISSTSPTDQENNVQPSRTIAVNFDSDVSQPGFSVSFSLQDSSNQPVVGNMAINGSSLTFSPNSSLASSTSYTASVGNNVGASNTIQPMTWSFTTATPSSGLCDSFYAAGFQLVEGMDNTQPSPGSKPAKAVEVTDAAYGTCYVRATDHANEPASSFARSDYSRRQAFNADDTMFIVYSNGGFWHLYDAQTFAYIKQVTGPAGDAEPQWHPTDPDKLYYFPRTGGMRILVADIPTDTFSTAADFNGRLPWANAARAWTKSEGSPSADGRYWGLQVETSNFAPVGLMVYDMQTDTIVSTFNTSRRPDHTSMSPSGDYILPSWENPEGTRAYTRDFSSFVQLHHKSAHSDIALLPNGNDAYVSVDYQSNLGDVFMIELQTGTKTVLFQNYISGTSSAMHFSGKAYNRPGWVLMSTYGPNLNGGSLQWIHDKVFAVELAANPRILNIMHHNAVVETYFAEPHASVNRDFTKIVVNSNWSGATGDIDVYMIKLPPGVIQ